METTQSMQPFPPGRTFPAAYGAPATASVRERLLGARAVAGVALASLVLGGLGGVLLGQVSASAGSNSGPGGGFGGPGTSQRGGFGNPQGTQTGPNGSTQQGQQGQPGQPPAQGQQQSATLPSQSGTTTSRSVTKRS